VEAMVQSSGQALKERLGEKVPCEDCGSEMCECVPFISGCSIVRAYLIQRYCGNMHLMLFNPLHKGLNGHCVVRCEVRTYVYVFRTYIPS
jgi:hypothetical protein